MKQKIKDLRVKIDGLSQLVKELKPIYIPGKRREATPELYMINSDEIKECNKSLLLGKCWLGKVLQELGQETPYKNDGNRKTVEDIEETADKAEAIAGLRKPFTNENNKDGIAKVIDTWELNGRSMSDYSNMYHIEKVDWLREEIKNTISNIPIKEICNIGYEIRVQFAIMHLSEARFHLGFELERIRNEG